MSIADRLSRVTLIRLSGREWPVLFTHGVLIECETITGLNLLNSASQLLRPPAKLIRTLIYLALRRAGCGLSQREIGATINPQNLPVLRNAILSAWSESMPEPEPAPEDGAEVGDLLTWMDAWAIARQDLGLSDAEWLDMTPRMLQALRRRQIQNLQAHEFMLSRLTAITANFSPCGPKDPYAFDHFMLHPFPPKVEDAGTPGDRLMAALRTLPKGAVVEAK